MCISYQNLNSITKLFEFPIPRYYDAIISVGAGSRKIWIILMDARQGYHQVSVKVSDREKLAFSAPDHQKYTFFVMPFVPTNAPGFYLAMMKNLRTNGTCFLSNSYVNQNKLETDMLLLLKHMKYQS